MNAPKWLSWAGYAAIIGGATAIVLTPPFATAYFSAYPGYDIPPFWVQPLRPALSPLLIFASPVTVYNLYGRIFDLIYLLMLPVVFGLHDLHRGRPSRLENAGFGILVVGLMTTFIGVAGDYWANGLTFLLSLLGLLVLAVGTTLYGVSLLRSRVLPGWCAWLFIADLPAAFIFQLLIWHIPSGPTFPFAVSWLIAGYVLLQEKRRATTHTPISIP